ncbi:uracil-DNA glycosylase family protein [Hymenobacter radiodurans]|uniref:uracil-DNA glycosylase family protein n=1 Tax=Hymenobacter radiodurans TaxID=2496028 RepID=UPI001058B3B0|nr:uracil-DNA glycosylase family protein [Hymenobacter radiodurans]
MSTFGARLLHFLTSFPLPTTLPDNVLAFSPYLQETPQALLTQFASRYYADNRPRVALLGINPGRLGNGRTGVAFTDPVALTACEISNALPQQREPSSQFVHEVIAALGGPAAFFDHFFLGSLYPLVLLREGRNYNYYDSPALTAALDPAIRLSLQLQVHDVGLRRDVAICLGRRNGEYLTRWNQELQLFDQIQILDHPRYLMQYKRRELAAHVAHYVAVLTTASQ